MTFLGEIIELQLQWGNFLENLMPALNKETKNKAWMLKIDAFCYFLPEMYLGPCEASKSEIFLQKGLTTSSR